jgi:hypothetical protein
MAYDLVLFMSILCVVFLGWPACGQAVRYQQHREHVRRSTFRVTREFQRRNSSEAKLEQASGWTVASTFGRVQPATDRPQGLIIVAPGLFDLQASLTDHLAATENVQVLFDRRRLERRQQVQTSEMDRRAVDRRRPPSRETDVHARQYVIVRPKQRTFLS